MYFNTSILRPLTENQIKAYAPAVYAESPSEKTSDKYLFVPTYKLVDALQSNGWSVVSARQTQNSKTSLDARMSNRHSLLLTPTQYVNRQLQEVKGLAPLIKINNAHNGLMSFSMANAIFRQVCANGLTLPEEIGAVPRIRHTTDMRDEVIEASYRVLSDSPKMLQAFTDMSKVTLSFDEKLMLADCIADVCLDIDQYKLDEHESARKRAWGGYVRATNSLDINHQLIHPKRYQDRADDLFTVTNVVQENIIRGSVKLASAKGLRSLKSVTSIDRDEKINQAILKISNHLKQEKLQIA